MRDDDDKQITFPFIPTKTEDYVIKKHKAIIHRTHFPTAVEEKIYNGLLLAAKVAFKTKDIDTLRKEGFMTSEKFIMNFSGVKTKDRKYVLERIDLLQSTPLKFDYFDQFDSFKELRSFPPISEVRYLAGGGIRYFLPPTILDALSDPDTFAAIDTQITSRFTCVYSIAVYEMGVMHMGESVEFTSLPELREYLGLRADEHKDSSDFRRHVIEKACNEVNAKTNVNVEYTLIREGRGHRLTGVRFAFTEAPDVIEVPADELQLQIIAKFCAMLPFELSGEPQIVKLLKGGLEANGEEWVQSNVEAFLNRMNDKSQTPVQKPGALLQATFKHDYGKDVRNAKRVAEIMAEQEAARKSKGSGDKEKKPMAFTVEDELADREAEARREIEKKYMIYFEKLPVEVQETITDGIEKLRSRQDPPMALFGTREAKITYYLAEVMGITL